MDDAAWLKLIRGNQPLFWAEMAEMSGGRAERINDVLAAIVPAAPNRSVFNSVFYEQPESLAAALPRIASAYDEAGVNAWTVWVPEADTDSAKLLEGAGHVLDAEPRAMGMELADYEPPDPAPGIEMTAEQDVAKMAEINEQAYGYPPGDMAGVLTEALPHWQIYVAQLDGEPVGTGMSADYGDDSEVTWIGTLPTAQHRGVGGEIMRACLLGARERGQKTTTLQASKAGAPVYERVGYRDFGALQMWERRKA